MGFRLKAIGLHLLASASVLTLILGALYLGWYRWPGWYLTDVSRVVLVMVCVDVVLGPLLTFIIASKNKPRRELVRDIGIIVVVQLCALVYGTTSLWNGRPLYYAFSETVLQQVQAYDLDVKEVELGQKQNPALAPQRNCIQLASRHRGNVETRKKYHEHHMSECDKDKYGVSIRCPLSPKHF
jgi:hypothetical protein